MTLRPSEILQVASEIAEALGGRTVQKAVQPEERAVALGFPNGWLYVSLSRRHGRLHLLDEKPPGTGEAATPFCMLLRKELIGLKLTAVEPVLGERAIGLEFARVGDESSRRRLLAFFYGAGAKLVLVDAESRALGALPQNVTAHHEAIDLPPPRDLPEGADKPRFAPPHISAQIAAHYAEADAHDAVEMTRTQAMAAARRDLDRARRKEEALERDLARIDASTNYRHHADLLLAHLGEVTKGAASVTLPDDFGDGAPLVIKLDPARSPQDNAAQLYHAYRRLQRGRATVENRLAAARKERAAAEAHLASIESATEAELPSLVAERQGSTTPRRPAPGKRATEAPRLPYRAYRSTSGARILVGKGADKNDELTFHVARGNDLWLHTRDVPGSHVIVPLAGRPIDEQTLLDAATLALWFSQARPIDEPRPGSPQAQADITYALRKLVRKPRGAPPGRVSVAGGKTLRIRLELERLKRLLDSRAE